MTVIILSEVFRIFLRNGESLRRWKYVLGFGPDLERFGEGKSVYLKLAI